MVLPSSPLSGPGDPAASAPLAARGKLRGRRLGGLCAAPGETQCFPLKRYCAAWKIHTIVSVINIYVKFQPLIPAKKVLFE